MLPNWFFDWEHNDDIVTKTLENILIVRHISIISITRGGPCQHGLICGCKRWSNDMPL